jgi:hypothetical protein
MAATRVLFSSFKQDDISIVDSTAIRIRAGYGIQFYDEADPPASSELYASIPVCGNSGYPFEKKDP